MGEIKSAFEIAMEKVEKLGKASDEERLRWKYIPEGEKLAARYLKQECKLTTELDGYEEGVVQYVKEGAADILIRNIGLSKDDSARRNNKTAMEGLKDLKSDKVSVENVFSKMRRVFNHYAEQGEQQRKQAYEQLKAQFEAKIQQAVQKQLGSSAGVRIDVEKQPQFQDEWLKLRAQLDAQYLQLIDEYKQELAAVA